MTFTIVFNEGGPAGYEWNIRTVVAVVNLESVDEIKKWAKDEKVELVAVFIGRLEDMLKETRNGTKDHRVDDTHPTKVIGGPGLARGAGQEVDIRQS